MTIRLRNDSTGYGLVTKVLHWLMVLALAAQFTIGYSMRRADWLLEGAVGRWLGGDEDRLLLLHAGLGVGILLMATLRVIWRISTALPPWAEGLSSVERLVAHRVEQVLYWSLFLMPGTGLGLLFLTGEEWDLGRAELTVTFELADEDLLLGAHIVAHVAFFVALVVHVGLVLKHQLIDRDRLLDRML